MERVAEIQTVGGQVVDYLCPPDESDVIQMACALALVKCIHLISQCRTFPLAGGRGYTVGYATTKRWGQKLFFVCRIGDEDVVRGLLVQAVGIFQPEPMKPPQRAAVPMESVPTRIRFGPWP
ncbi:hypothetical protein EPN28_01625 [Patescibacteria group bacterium]|nr:MAG: hypothetical protein EPN28_01625 [Patescibacteria group bacterium]